jgi:hypothetical protein
LGIVNKLGENSEDGKLLGIVKKLGENFENGKW